MLVLAGPGSGPVHPVVSGEHHVAAAAQSRASALRRPGVGGSMVLTRPNGAPPTVLHVIPVEDAEMSFRSPRVAALLLIIDIDPTRPGRIAPELVAAAWD